MHKNKILTQTCLRKVKSTVRHQNFGTENNIADNDKLSLRLHQLSRQYKRFSMVLLCVFAFIDTVSFMVAIESYIGGRMSLDELSGTLPYYVLVFAAEFLLYVGMAVLICRDETLRRLKTVTDPMYLPFLLELPSFPWKYMNIEINRAIGCLLTKVNAENDDLFTAAHLDMLWKRAMGMYQSTKGFDPDFAIVAIRAIAYIGDENSLNRLYRLMGTNPANPMQAKIRPVASDCILTLEARIARSNIQMTLLRSSSASHASVDTLVRPVSTSEVGTGHEQLLRSGIDPNGADATRRQ